MKITYVLTDDIDRPEDELNEILPLLPPYRREKVMRCRFLRDRLLSLCAGMLALGSHGGEIALQDGGKPYFIDQGIRFSLTHSDRCAAIAVSRYELGLDVEPLTRGYHDSMLRSFHHNEAAYIDRAVDRDRAFVEIWTRKEAYVKYLGTGLSEGLSSFDTTSAPLSASLFTFERDGYLFSAFCPQDREWEIRKISFRELKEWILRRNAAPDPAF